MNLRTAAILVLVLFASITCDKQSTQLDQPLYSAPSFKLIDQNGNEFSSESLKGKPWIATLFFSTCNGPCPMMSMRLREIQEAVNLPELMIVSISCDPEHDTPAVLKNYADTRGADPTRWIFLTGQYEQVKAAADGLKLYFEPAIKDSPITHSTQFLLIDRDGNVRGVYHHDDDQSLQELKNDSARLVGE